MVMMEIMVSNISFMQHNSTKYTILKTSAHTHKTDRVEGESGKNKDKYTGPVAKSCPVSIGIYFRLLSFSLAV